jgi:hypothetical protein
MVLWLEGLSFYKVLLVIIGLLLLLAILAVLGFFINKRLKDRLRSRGKGKVAKQALKIAPKQGLPSNSGRQSRAKSQSI